MRHGKHSVLAGCCVCLGAIWVIAAEAPGTEGVPTYVGITRPSGDVSMSFTLAGRVRKVLVKPGQEVQPGQELVQLDDTVERLEMERLKAQAEDTVRVKAAEAQLAQKKSDLKKLEDAFKRGASTEQEVEHAQLDVVIAELSVQLAAFEHKQDQAKYEQAKAQIERMRLISPITGVVEKLSIDAGEVADPQKECIRLVNIDPLWIDAPVPREKAVSLKPGQAVEVEFGRGANPSTQAVPGKVLHVAAEADAASETLLIRLELPNPEKRPAGEHVTVHLAQVEAPRIRSGAVTPSATTNPAKEK